VESVPYKNESIIEWDVLIELLIKLKAYSSLENSIDATPNTNVSTLTLSHLGA